MYIAIKKNQHFLKIEKIDLTLKSFLEIAFTRILSNIDFLMAMYIQNLKTC